MIQNEVDRTLFQWFFYPNPAVHAEECRRLTSKKIKEMDSVCKLRYRRPLIFLASCPQMLSHMVEKGLNIEESCPFLDGKTLLQFHEFLMEVMESEKSREMVRYLQNVP